jgi:hypothetical protein
MSTKTLVVVGLIACGSRDPVSRAPVPRAVPVLPDVAFAELDHDQRIELMKTHVIPTITPVFQRHEPKKFAVVDCKTCHAEADWKMPNTELPQLDVSDLGEFDPRDVEWMKNEIVPTMRGILRDPALRCGRCHPLRGP